MFLNSKEPNPVLKETLKSDKEFASKWVVFCQIVCALPANFELNSKKCDLGYRKLGKLIFHLLWCFLILVAITSETLKRAQKDVMGHVPTIQRGLYMSEYVANVLTTALIMVFSYKNRNRFERYILGVQALQRKSVQFAALVELTNEAARKMGTVVIVVIAYFVIETILTFIFNEYKFWGIYTSVMVYTVPNMIMATTQMQYHYLLLIIREKFKTINSVLKRYSATSSEPDELPCLLSVEISVGNPGLKSDLYVTLKNLRAFFSEIDMFLTEVNAGFSVVLLAIFIGSYLILSIQIFTLYELIEKRHIDIKISEVMYMILWIIMHGAKMLIVLNINNSISYEKTQSGQLINELGAQSDLTEHVIERFQLQMMSQNKVKTSGGIIELNMLMLGGILSALTTYVIFLIQIDLSEDTLDAASPD